MRPENRIRKRPPVRIEPEGNAGLLSKPIATLTMSVRAINMLEEHNVLTVGDLLQQTYQSLSRMRNFGTKSLAEVQQALQALNIPVPDWNPPKEVRRSAICRKPEELFDLYG